MKKSTYIVAIIGLFLFSSSCSDKFLDLAPISSMNEANFFKTEADFKTAINGAYRTLYNVYSPDNALSHSEQMTDNCTLYHVANNSEEQMQLLNYTVLANNGFILNCWNTYYNSLFVINKVIDKLPGSLLDANLKTEYEAEMRFLRAIYYFDMVRFWGDVPLLIKPVSVAESYTYGRTPVADIYSQIITDLKFAETNLLPKSQIVRVGQASIGGAQGMLGKVYATTGDVENAKIYLKKVIDATTDFALLPSYDQLWDLKHENSKEAIFEIQYIRGVDKPSSRYYQAYCPDGKIIYGGGQNPVTDNLWNEYETSDKRRDLSINESYTDAGVVVKTKFPKKWTDIASVAVKSTYYSENNFIVLRYADILLLYAELTKDATYLNQVRARAGVPLWGDAGYPGGKYPTIELAVEHERRVELALEFQRWFDLKRTNRAITVISNAKGKTIADWQLLFPIPQSVIDQNPAVLTQNANY